MTTLLALLVLVSTGVPAFASNNGIESQVVANSTQVDVAPLVARRQINSCTPSWYGGIPDGTDPTRYLCYSRGYTQVPNIVWIAATTQIELQYNDISFITVNAFDGLTLMTHLYLNNNVITSVPVGFLNNTPALLALVLSNNVITLIPAGLVDNNPALEKLSLSDNNINSIPTGLVDSNLALTSLYLSANPLVCSNFNPYGYGPWVVGTAISSFCTSCTDGTPETITIGTVGFWQCSTCILKNDAPSSTQVNDAMEVFCPDYATDVGVQGKPEFGGSAKMCRARDNKYETRLHQSMFHGMFGGASSSGRVCKAWCLYDVEEQNRHFRWDNKNGCWKTRKNRPCRDSTNQEREFAADIFDSFCG